MTATLKNNSKQAVVLVLDHPAFATKESGWKRTAARFGTTTDEGARVVSEVRRSYAGSLTILPGEAIDGLHEAIASCAQVPALVASKVLTLTVQSDDEPPAVKPKKGSETRESAHQPLGDVEIQKTEDRKKG